MSLRQSLIYSYHCNIVSCSYLGENVIACIPAHHVWIGCCPVTPTVGVLFLI